MEVNFVLGCLWGVIVYFLCKDMANLVVVTRYFIFRAMITSFKKKNLSSRHL